MSQRQKEIIQGAIILIGGFSAVWFMYMVVFRMMAHALLKAVGF